MIVSNAELYGVMVDKVIGMEAMDFHLADADERFNNDIFAEFIKGCAIEAEKKMAFFRYEEIYRYY